MLERVVKKTGAEAHTEIVSFKYGVVPAALAALLELRIIGKFGERYGPESEFVVYFHDCGSGGYAEYPGVWIELA